MKIVLTGAPGAGKTSCLNILKKVRRDCVYCPEIATELLSKILPQPPVGPDASLLFGRACSDLQFIQEQSMDADPERIYILDRGLWDSEAFNVRWSYVPRPWKERYDQVFLLELPPKEEWGGNNPHRFHTYEQSLEVEQRLKTIYAGAVTLGGSLSNKVNNLNTFLEGLKQ